MASQLRRQVAGGVAVAGVAFAALFVSPDFVLQQVERVTANPWLAGVAFAVVYLVRPLFAWPLTLVAAAVGYVYGPVVGFPIALVGGVVSSLPPFLAARYFQTDAGLVSRIGKSGGQFFAATGDLRGMVAARFAPIPSDAISAAAGLSGVSVLGFVVGSAIGETPWMAAAVVMGASLGSLSTDGIEGIDLRLVVATAAAALVLLAGPTYELYKSRRSAETDAKTNQ